MYNYPLYIYNFLEKKKNLNISTVSTDHYHQQKIFSKKKKNKKYNIVERKGGYVAKKEDFLYFCGCYLK